MPHSVALASVPCPCSRYTAAFFRSGEDAEVGARQVFPDASQVPAGEKYAGARQVEFPHRTASLRRHAFLVVDYGSRFVP